MDDQTRIELEAAAFLLDLGGDNTLTAQLRARNCRIGGRNFAFGLTTLFVFAFPDEYCFGHAIGYLSLKIVVGDSSSTTIYL